MVLRRKTKAAMPWWCWELLAQTRLHEELRPNEQQCTAKAVEREEAVIEGRRRNLMVPSLRCKPCARHMITTRKKTPKAATGRKARPQQTLEGPTSTAGAATLEVKQAGPFAGYPSVGFQRNGQALVAGAQLQEGNSLDANPQGTLHKGKLAQDAPSRQLVERG